MTDEVLIERRDDVLGITLNRPESGNLVNNEIGEKIISALAEIGSGVKLVRLQGSGADFCRGRESPAIDRANARAREFRDKIADPALALYAAFMNCRAPVLGVVKGRAAGVGCTLAAICDLSVASEDAVFQVPEMNRSIPPTLVMSAMVGRVPANAIAHLVLTREPIGARRALELGIVGDIAPAAEVDRRADEIEARVLECSAQSVQAVKEYLRAAPAMDQAGRIAFAANLIATVLSSP
jgi:enoyl-CoA hydratase/carnithine racemase